MLHYFYHGKCYILNSVDCIYPKWCLIFPMPCEKNGGDCMSYFRITNTVWGYRCIIQSPRKFFPIELLSLVWTQPNSHVAAVSQDTQKGSGKRLYADDRECGTVKWVLVPTCLRLLFLAKLIRYDGRSFSSVNLSVPLCYATHNTNTIMRCALCFLRSFPFYCLYRVPVIILYLILAQSIF